MDSNVRNGRQTPSDAGMCRCKCVHVFTAFIAVVSFVFLSSTPSAHVGLFSQTNAVPIVEPVFLNSFDASYECDSPCTLKGITATCIERITWLMRNSLQHEKEAVSLARRRVSADCRVCQNCSVSPALTSPLNVHVPPCDSLCTCNGSTATCIKRIEWLVENTFAHENTGISLAHRQVLAECSVCQNCSVPLDLQTFYDLRFAGEKCPFSYTFGSLASLAKCKMRSYLKQAPMTGFSSCALVGSSGSLLQKSNGKTIDRHTMVMRSNLAPTKGFEKHVGSKTHFRVMNSETCRRILGSFGRQQTRSGVTCTQLASEGVIFNNVLQDLHSVEHHCEKLAQVCSVHVKLFQHSDAGKSNLRPVVFHELAAGENISEYWQTSTLDHHARMAPLGSYNSNMKWHYTTGSLSLLMAAAMCPNGVSLYGFTHFKMDKHSKYHYFDAVIPKAYDNLDESVQLIEKLVGHEFPCLRFV